MQYHKAYLDYMIRIIKCHTEMIKHLQPCNAVSWIQSNEPRLAKDEVFAYGSGRPLPVFVWFVPVGIFLCIFALRGECLTT